MSLGRLYSVVTGVALCGMIWFLVVHTYGKYREMQDEPILIAAPPVSVPGRTPLPEELVVTLPATEDVMAIIERPMFSPSRRPGEAAVDAAEADSASILEFDLVGIVIWRGQRIALVRSGNDPAIIRIGVGGNVAGWVAIGIEPEYVRFRNGENEEDLHLKYVNSDSNG